MRKALFLAIALALLPALASADTLINNRNKIGTTVSCTRDTDVDTAFSTTVDADSASGQQTLNLTATTNLVAGDTLLIDRQGDGDGKEVCVVSSVSAGVSVDCVDNLTYTHLGATGDDVTLTNRIGPLSEGQTYFIQLMGPSSAPQAGQWLQGDQYVDAENNGGVYTASSLGRPGIMAKATSKYQYISFKTTTANAIGTACKVE